MDADEFLQESIIPQAPQPLAFEIWVGQSPTPIHTARYTHVATGLIAGIKSPLDLLAQPRRKPGKKPDTGEKDQPPA